MTKAVFNILLTAFLTLSFSVFTSCSKSEYYDETTPKEQNQDNGKGQSTSNGDDNDNNSGNKDNESKDVLTVEEFINSQPSEGVYVEGYIIGDCTKAFKYAEFEPPFTHEQAVLIADNTDERNKDYIVAVQLPSGTKRKDLNLVDHPEYLHRKVVLCGSWARYLYMDGLKNLYYYKVE